jgi:hypothetical protein
VAVTLARDEGLATLVADTSTVCGLVTLGARKSPVPEIVPVLADHTTAVLLVFSTRAVNCRIPSEGTLGLTGVSAIRGVVFPDEDMDCRVWLHAVRPAKEARNRIATRIRTEDEKSRGS